MDKKPKRAEAGCFVLITNRPLKGKDAQSSEDILRTYKAQDGIERNFSLLKDPLIVNNIFLKKPSVSRPLGWSCCCRFSSGTSSNARYACSSKKPIRPSKD